MGGGLAGGDAGDQADDLAHGRAARHHPVHAVLLEPLLPLAGSLLLLVPGTVLLVRFLRRYRLPTDEERHAA